MSWKAGIFIIQVGKKIIKAVVGVPPPEVIVLTKIDRNNAQVLLLVPEHPIE